MRAEICRLEQGQGNLSLKWKELRLWFVRFSLRREVLSILRLPELRNFDYLVPPLPARKWQSPRQGRGWREYSAAFELLQSNRLYHKCCTSALGIELAFADLSADSNNERYSGRSQELVKKIQKLRGNRIEEVRHRTWLVLHQAAANILSHVSCSNDLLRCLNFMLTRPGWGHWDAHWVKLEPDIATRSHNMKRSLQLAPDLIG